MALLLPIKEKGLDSDNRKERECNIMAANKAPRSLENERTEAKQRGS